MYPKCTHILFSLVRWKSGTGVTFKHWYLLSAIDMFQLTKPPLYIYLLESLSSSNIDLYWKTIVYCCLIPCSLIGSMSSIFKCALGWFYLIAYMMYTNWTHIFYPLGRGKVGKRVPFRCWYLPSLINRFWLQQFIFCFHILEYSSSSHTRFSKKTVNTEI